MCKILLFFVAHSWDGLWNKMIQIDFDFAWKKRIHKNTKKFQWEIFLEENTLFLLMLTSISTISVSCIHRSHSQRFTKIPYT